MVQSFSSLRASVVGRNGGADWGIYVPGGRVRPAGVLGLLVEREEISRLELVSS